MDGGSITTVVKTAFFSFSQTGFFCAHFTGPCRLWVGLGGTDYRQCSTRSLKPSKFLNEASAANGSSELLHFVRFFRTNGFEKAPLPSLKVKGIK